MQEFWESYRVGSYRGISYLNWKILRRESCGFDTDANGKKNKLPQQ